MLHGDCFDEFHDFKYKTPHYSKVGPLRQLRFKTVAPDYLRPPFSVQQLISVYLSLAIDTDVLYLSLAIDTDVLLKDQFL